MSVSFITPPGPMTGTSKPVEFTTTTRVTSISVEFHPHLGNGLRETAFDGTNQDGTTGGDFSYLYRASTRGDGFTWQLSRQGTWPGEFRIRIQEVTPQSASTWSTLYECDLTTLPNQTINGATGVNTYGAFTMDGQPWYWHGASGQANLVHGQGLVGSVSGYRNLSIPYGGYFVGLRVHAMTGWDPLKETVCQVKFSGAMSLLTGSLDFHVGCGIWSGAETWGYGPGNNAQLTLLRAAAVSWSDGQSKALAVKSGSENQSNVVLGARVQPFNLAGSYASNGRLNYREGLWLRDHTSPVGDVESMLSLGCENGTGGGQAGDYKMGFVAGNSGAGGATSGFVGTYVRVLQRAVT